MQSRDSFRFIYHHSCSWHCRWHQFHHRWELFIFGRINVFFLTFWRPGDFAVYFVNDCSSSYPAGFILGCRCGWMLQCLLQAHRSSTKGQSLELTETANRAWKVSGTKGTPAGRFLVSCFLSTKALSTAMTFETQYSCPVTKVHRKFLQCFWPSMLCRLRNHVTWRRVSWTRPIALPAPLSWAFIVDRIYQLFFFVQT